MSLITDIDTSPNSDHQSIQALHHTLTAQATRLLSELTAFSEYLDHSHDQSTGSPAVKSGPLLSKFQVDVQRELKHLLRYSADIDGGDHDSQHATSTIGQVNGSGAEQGVRTTKSITASAEDLDGIHRIRSSNITFLSDVWDGAKRYKGIMGIRKGVKYVPVAISVSGSSIGVKTDAMRNGEPSTSTADSRLDSTGGVPGVSKRMNREARERVKMERKLRSSGLGRNECISNSINHGVNGCTDETANDYDNNIETPQETPQTTTTSTEPLTPSRKYKGNRIWNTDDTPEHNTRHPRQRLEKESVTVDIIADHGATWIKMFTKNQRWLLMDLAKEGIVDIDKNDSDGSDNDYEGDLCNGTVSGRHNEAMEELKLVKMGREFLAAARSVRVGLGHRHPKVVFAFSKIERGSVRDVDRVLEYLERTSIEVVTADQIHSSGATDTANGDGDEIAVEAAEGCKLGLSKAFLNMASPPPAVPITKTLNVDCTVLIALISDISHSRRPDLTIPEHYKGTARRDIETQLQTDVEDPLLPNQIYPILRGRKLVCTRKATEHWRNIVRIMGSRTEALRCRILLGQADDENSRDLSARELLQSLSVHGVPEDLQVPIEVLDFDLDDMDPAKDGSQCGQVEIDVMRKLAKEPRLSSLNSSVFFHGWYRGWTTVSLNRVVSEWLTRAINVVLDNMELKQGMASDIAKVIGFHGTNAIVCGRERSLLGSGK